MSNNFLQHLDVAEAIVPFVAWDVLQYKLQNDSTCYTFGTYEALFKTFFPEIADVPHNSKMGAEERPGADPQPLQQGVGGIRVAGIYEQSPPAVRQPEKSDSALDRRTDGPSRRGSGQRMFLYRLFLLDQRLSRSGIN